MLAERHVSVTEGMHSCNSGRPSVVSASSREPGLCCAVVLCWFLTEVVSFKCPQFHAVLVSKHRQLAPRKCTGSLDFCPPVPQRAQSYKHVHPLCPGVYELGFTMLLYSPLPFSQGVDLG